MATRPLYDLSLGDNDFACRTGAPSRTVVLCSHPRSGSTLLGEAIHFAGGLGCPLEYLHRGFRPTLAERWEAPLLDDYIAAMHRWRTDPSGTFSIKLFWQDVEDVAHERAPDRFTPAGMRRADDLTTADYRAYHAMLADILPGADHIFLDRRDVVRQAVSVVVATQTGLWRAIPGVGPTEAVAPASYDYHRIAAMIAVARESNDHWANYFEANDIAPIRVSYEDMVRNYAGVVGPLLATLGRSGELSPRRMQRQSDGTVEAIVLRFLQDHATRKG